jgi:hypothetical protein
VGEAGAAVKLTVANVKDCNTGKLREALERKFVTTKLDPQLVDCCRLSVTLLAILPYLNESQLQVAAIAWLSEHHAELEVAE